VIDWRVVDRISYIPRTSAILRSLADDSSTPRDWLCDGRRLRSTFVINTSSPWRMPIRLRLLTDSDKVSRIRRPNDDFRIRRNSCKRATRHSDSGIARKCDWGGSPPPLFFLLLPLFYLSFSFPFPALFPLISR